LLEKYQEHATLFLITGWWALDNYQSPYLDVQSHTHNLHFEAQCADGRGKVACSDYKTVKADLEQSINVLHDTTSFCFPFYSYDKEALQALRELNFRVAFIGGNVDAKRSQDNLLVTRYPILSDITLNHFINIVK
jgi:peptidoglycan/xylan/chitin deacetylase (PgdA/CDA1 family)